MRQLAINPIAYRPPAGFENQVEARTIRAFRAPHDHAQFLGNHRIDFHFVLIVTAGSAHHAVDFSEHPLGEGSVVWVRPGQVQRWADLWAIEGYAVIFPAELLDPLVDPVVLERAGTAWQLVGEPWSEVLALARVLANTHERRDDRPGDELRRAEGRHALAALLLRLARSAETVEGGGREPIEAFDAFRRAVDRDFGRERRVSAYARALGYSERTLERAARSATGLTPKQLIDARVLLEAKRLLAHSELSAARVGAAVGFDDASNFTSWFATRAGMRPSQFRRAVR